MILFYQSIKLPEFVHVSFWKEIEFTMGIVERIRALANEQGLSLPNLEVKLGLGNGTISRWSKSAPNTDKLQKVADFFNVSMDYLLGRSEKDDELAGVYFNFAKEAQESGVDPDDIKLALETIRKIKGEDK
jgi:transcriptional regulator with XRE-family HTH domain